jgi:hypothetical protein
LFKQIEGVGFENTWVAEKLYLCVLIPPLMLISWLADRYIDKPCREFAAELDQASRSERDRKEKDGEDPSFWERLWSTSSWKIIAFFSWFAFIFIVTEVYLSIGDNNDKLSNKHWS